jgi:NAD(P)-dependent dehydrogenase (short-subunit alcohol dehydrogenase family)
MPNEPIVVVTGANRGIGLEISRQLATRGSQVVLTARKSGAGKAAVKRLAAQNLTVQFRPLDVTSGKSIVALREVLKRTYGRLDVLINNAGIIAVARRPVLTSIWKPFASRSKRMRLALFIYHKPWRLYSDAASALAL